MATVKALAVVLLAAALFGGGYWAGHSRADAVRIAEVASLKAEYSAAQADAERQARERLEQETARANDLAERLQSEKGRIQIVTRTIPRRIPDAARSAAGCSFGPDFVELYNDALGYPRARGGSPVPESPGAVGTDIDAGPSAAPVGGLLPGKPVTPPVTPEDLLAHARDYGAWARGLEAQLRALGELLKDGR